MKDWRRKRLCMTCSAVLAAHITEAYRVEPDQEDSQPKSQTCDRCGKTKPCRGYRLVPIRSKREADGTPEV